MALDACLNSIYRQTAGRALVVVVDNGSEDGSQDHIRANHPTVQLIEAGRNLLLAACNLGIRAALADPACRYVALLNDDAWAADDWLERLLAFAEQHADGAGFRA